MSHPKSRSLFVFVIVLAVTALVIGVYLLTQKQSGHPNFANYQIVYLCDGDMAGKIQQICIINGDGSGKKVLISGEASKDSFYSPVMNNKGQIVYFCSSTESAGDIRSLSFGICAIRADGSGRGKLDVTKMEVGFNYPIINNAGQVFFSCKDAICFTTLNPDGSFPKDVQKIPLDPAMTHSELSHISVNDKGIGVYLCLDTTGIEEAQRQDPDAGMKELFSRPRNICAFNSEDKSVKQLTSSPSGTSYFDAAINNSGRLVFTCGSPVVPGFGVMGATRGTDICSMIADGSAQRQLTRSQSPSYKFGSVINDRGQIVFDCSENLLNSRLCAMNSDGSNFRQITPSDNLASSGNPSINDDGVVAYICSLSICIMNFDGSDQRQLTTYKSAQSHTFGSVQIR
ncbi:hypothetical protein HY229_01160 [Candidatus Acetothermia bacterium]|nr:hypothetical protein [Candidatus Acetothermia bacterium]MBI3642697.1 hypothetical protein [Candidatus Acetothermia bacterium]